MPSSAVLLSSKTHYLTRHVFTSVSKSRRPLNHAATARGWTLGRVPSTGNAILNRGRALHQRGTNGPHPPLAFAFDIDGVLIQGEKVLPQARRALKALDGENELGVKIPYILMTNGGGRSEKARCEALTRQLGVEISISQFMQAHTVLKSVVAKYADAHVLCLGGTPGKVPQVAEEYGFKNVVTTLDILAWNPSIWPLHSLDTTERAFADSRPPFNPSTRIAAIFVFHDPRNWALDIQVVCDILRKNGHVTPGHEKGSASEANVEPVELVFCNPDLLWGSDFPAPRFGQGAFKVAMQAVFKARNGHEYPFMQYGKPTAATYKFAERLLRERLAELRQVEGKDVRAEDVELPTVYMVGDNPESDIAGANAVGWPSVLVETGVYNRADGDPTHRPTVIQPDVEYAVRWAMERELRRRQ